MKRKKLSLLARALENCAIRLENLCDDVQDTIPKRSLVQMREAVRSLDDAAYSIDEEAARKK